MKRHLFVVAKYLILIVFFEGCSSTGAWRAKNIESGEYKRERVAKRFHSDMPVVVNDNVLAWMEYFQGPGRRHFERYLARSGRYLPMMQRILKEEGVPEDLVFISLIESGFNPHARSRARAMGAWQFMSGTGRMYGLYATPWEDERRDPEQATRAAARHFKDLYQELGDWYLCMAAYNAGVGKVRRAMAQSGSRDFWVIAEPRRKLLRPETRDYVPKYIAAMLMAKNPKKFGFDDIEYEKPLAYDHVTVPSQTDFNVIATSAGVSISDIRDLNPHLLRDVTPHGKRDYRVKIPAGTKEQFKENYAAVPVEKRVTIASHRVQRGETLSKIANRYGVGIAELRVANNLRQRSHIHPGQQLVIPREGRVIARAPQAKPVPRADSTPEEMTETATAALESKPTGQESVTPTAQAVHTVRRGESLWTISQHYNVGLSELMKVNHVMRGSRLHPGQKLTLPTDISSPLPSSNVVVAVEEAAIKHHLQPGETLGHVAEKYGVRARDIMQWNGIRNPRRVRAGTILEVKRTSIGL